VKYDKMISYKLPYTFYTKPFSVPLHTHTKHVATSQNFDRLFVTTFRLYKSILTEVCIEYE